MLTVPSNTEELISEIRTITEVKPMLTKIAEQIRAEGGHKAKQEDARRMLDEGFEVELICRVTGLSREEVESLRKQ